MPYIKEHVMSLMETFKSQHPAGHRLKGDFTHPKNEP